METNKLSKGLITRWEAACPQKLKSIRSDFLKDRLNKIRDKEVDVISLEFLTYFDKKKKIFF